MNAIRFLMGITSLPDYNIKQGRNQLQKAEKHINQVVFFIEIYIFVFYNINNLMNL